MGQVRCAYVGATVDGKLRQDDVANTLAVDGLLALAPHHKVLDVVVHRTGAGIQLAREGCGLVDSFLDQIPTSLQILQ